MIIDYYNTAKKYLIIAFLLVYLPAAINGLFFSTFKENIFLFWAYDFFQWILMPYLALMIVIKQKKIITFYHLGFHNLIFHRRNWEYIIYLGFIFSIVLHYSYFPVYTFTELIFPTNYFWSFSYQSIIPKHSVFLALLVTIYLAFSAGFVEETFYRGLLKIIFQDDFTFNYKYILISSFLFSLNHWEGGVRNIFSAFIFGVLTAIIYLKIKNIWPLVIGHTWVDICAFYPFTSPF
jgi:membrane protease YdiL (CAAX protease family)